MLPDEIASRILFEDDNMIILDKPAGIAVHAAPGAGIHMDSWLTALSRGPVKPGLAHRLDRDTSGCLVLGRHPAALRRLGHLFEIGANRKQYWAVVEGRPAAAEGVIKIGISRFRREKLWLSHADEKGSPAETKYQVLGFGDGRSWLALEPLTGRTHQIRVHCAFVGCPVVADLFYGRPGHPGERLHLHARSIAIPYYSRDNMIVVSAEPPLQMRSALSACGWPRAEDLATASG